MDKGFMDEDVICCMNFVKRKIILVLDECTVDASEILRSPVEVGSFIPHDLQGLGCIPGIWSILGVSPTH